MPPRKKIDLPDHVRAAVLADVALSHQQATDADVRSKVRIYLATEQGLDTYEIAERLGLGQSTISKYRLQGKEAYERRESARDQPASPDPDRPGQLVSNR